MATPFFVGSLLIGFLLVSDMADIHGWGGVKLDEISAFFTVEVYLCVVGIFVILITLKYCHCSYTRRLLIVHRSLIKSLG